MECRLLIGIDMGARHRVLAVALLLSTACVACGGATVRIPSAKPSSRAMAELWIDPGKEPRDLKYGIGGAQRAPEARFRPKLPELKRLDEPWTWQDNPFVGTAPHNGLLAVRDLGASLGETGKLFPRRNYLPGFEKEGFIDKVENGRLEFAYKGRHEELLSILRPSDVRWAAERLSRLTDRQWRDAFRAANYADPIADRYLARITEKFAVGLALPLK